MLVIASDKVGIIAVQVDFIDVEYVLRRFGDGLGTAHEKS